ncbi:hypothetical protein BKA63DRAFT_560223 [Paraphoma chrysanthemicola]|nr:hypothetical protein BKA63DRAFT_560223 [Paraphoma chrysanthemicola]
MCIDLAIRYDCGHKIVSNFPCKSKKCKSIEKYTKAKARRCRVCDRDETARISRERDLAVQSAQTIQSLLDAVLRDVGAAEHRYFHAEQARKEGYSRIEELECALREATERTPMPLAMCTEIKFTFACQHTTTKHWCPNDDEPDECRFQPRLRAGIGESCMECRQQETTRRDNDIKKLQDSFAAEEHRVKILQDRVESLKETLSIAKLGLRGSPEFSPPVSENISIVVEEGEQDRSIGKDRGGDRMDEEIGDGADPELGLASQARAGVELVAVPA